MLSVKLNKQFFALVMVAAMMISLFAVFPTTSAKAASVTVNVKLMGGKNSSAALTNFNAIESALLKADGSTTVNIVLPKNGTYYVDTPGRSLAIRSNTTINLNGSALLRYGKMIDQNMFQNADTNGNRTTGGYTLSKNITLKNGTIDGNCSMAESAKNLINFGHALNIMIDNVKLKNVYQGHLIELSGCKDSTVKNCTFEGFYGTPNGANEAIQLDISKNSWNGIYKSDNTVCSNITVTGCTFNNFPSGVGNHHTLTGRYHNKNITISNNTFNNAKSYSTLGAAVWCYGFDSSAVKNNKIIGKYSDGIKISAGKVNVSSNTINTKFVKNSSGIYVSHASSHIYTYATPSKRSNEYVTGGNISDNEISGYAKNAIAVTSSSKIGNIKSNIIKSAKGTGIYITNSTVSGCISANEVIGSKYVSSDNGGHGIHITSTATVKKVTGNMISKCAGYGIAHYSRLVTVNVTGNMLKSNALGAQKVSGSGKVSYIAEVPPTRTGSVKNAAATVSSIKLTWSAVSGAAGSVVYRYNSSKGSWDRVKKLSGTSYTDKKLKAGTTYQYMIRSYKTYQGKELLSIGRTLSTSTKPANVTNFKCTSKTASSAKLSWSKVTGAAGYIIYRYDSKTKSWTEAGRTTGATFNVTSLKSATGYKFGIQAYRMVDKVQFKSVNKATVKVTTNS